MERELKTHVRFQQWFNNTTDTKKWFARNGFSAIIAVILLIIVLGLHSMGEGWAKREHIYYVILFFQAINVPATTYVYINKIDLRTKEDETWKRYRKEQKYLIIASVICMLLILYSTITF